MTIEELEQWQAEFEQFHARFADLFERSESREQAKKYLRGLLAQADRKNNWQVAEVVGDAIAHCFGHLPAILALRLGEEPAQVFAGLLTRLAALEQVGKARVKRFKVVLPLLQCFLCHALPPTQILLSY